MHIGLYALCPLGFYWVFGEAQVSRPSTSSEMLRFSDFLQHVPYHVWETLARWFYNFWRYAVVARSFFVFLFELLPPPVLQPLLLGDCVAVLLSTRFFHALQKGFRLPPF
jgi:hypothetical protein